MQETIRSLLYGRLQCFGRQRKQETEWEARDRERGEKNEINEEDDRKRMDRNEKNEKVRGGEGCYMLREGGMKDWDKQQGVLL